MCELQLTNKGFSHRGFFSYRFNRNFSSNFKEKVRNTQAEPLEREEQPQNSPLHQEEERRDPAQDEGGGVSGREREAALQVLKLGQGGPEAARTVRVVDVVIFFYLF